MLPASYTTTAYSLSPSHAHRTINTQLWLLEGSVATNRNASRFTVVYRNAPGEQYFHVTMETGKYCSPGAFSYTTFFACAET